MRVGWVEVGCEEEGKEEEEGCVEEEIEFLALWDVDQSCHSKICKRKKGGFWRDVREVKFELWKAWLSKL